jgi:general secretion pathway protein M
MIERLKRWWSDRSAREKLMLAFLGEIVLVGALWFGIYVPLSHALLDARDSYKTSVTRYYGAVTKTQKLRMLAREGASVRAGDLKGVLAGSAAAAGFTIENAQARGDGSVLISIPSARFGALFAWIADMEKQHILLESATFAPTEPTGTLSFSGSFTQSRAVAKP